eukprot:188224_1
MATTQHSSHMVAIIFCILNIIIIGSILLIHLNPLKHGFNQSIRNRIDPNHEKKSKLLLTQIIIVNLIWQCFFFARLLTCWKCLYLLLITRLFFIISRTTNYLLFTHHAKLAKELNPILSKETLQKTIPFFVICYGIILCIITVAVPLLNGMDTFDTVCFNDTDLPKIEYCIFDGHNNVGRITGVLLIAVIDIFITVPLLYLYIKPLCYIYNHMRFNSHQQKTKQKLRSLLKWSLIMVFINLISTNIYIVVVGIAGSDIKFIFNAKFFYHGISVTSSWLIMKENRDYCKWLFINCCSPESTVKNPPENKVQTINENIENIHQDKKELPITSEQSTANELQNENSNIELNSITSNANSNTLRTITSWRSYTYSSATYPSV